MKKLIKTFASVSFVILMTSCQKDHMLDCFKSTGDVITEERTSAPFSDIQLDDNVDLIIHPNSQPYIRVTAGENLIDGIITELSGNKLYIRNENRCNWMRSFKNTYTVEVGMDKPANIVYYGSGDIHCSDTIKTDEFHFDCTNGSGSINFLLDCSKCFIRNHTGRTDIHLKGNCGYTYVYVNDVATLEGAGLNSYSCFIRNSSTGDVKMKVLNDLGVEILYNGNIYYSGNAAVNSEVITGKGKLIPY